MKLNDEQKEALKQLGAALTRATETGLLDQLEINCNDPDAINDVCDAVTWMEEHCL